MEEEESVEDFRITSQETEEDATWLRQKDAPEFTSHASYDVVCDVPTPSQ